MCGGQPSIVPYLFLGWKDDIVLLALQFYHSCVQHCMCVWRDKNDKKIVLCIV